MVNGGIVDISKFRLFLRNNIYNTYTLNKFKDIIEETFTDEIKSIYIDDNNNIVMELYGYKYGSTAYYIALHQCMYDLLTSPEISNDINIKIHSNTINNADYKILKTAYSNVLKYNCASLLTNIVFLDSSIIIEL